jgi:hypothetical protein
MSRKTNTKTSTKTNTKTSTSTSTIDERIAAASLRSAAARGCAAGLVGLVADPTLTTDQCDTRTTAA